MLIKIEGDNWVNPERVSSVKLVEIENTATVVVQLQEGEPILIGKLGISLSLSEVRDQIANKVNEAIAQERSSRK